MLERRARLLTGLVMALFVTFHLLSHATGIVSFDWLESARRVHVALWQHPVGTSVLYGALVVHLALALRSLYRRRTLRMPAWEACQLGFGLAVPLLLVGHVLGTRGAISVLGLHLDYPYVITVLWNDGWLRGKQIVLVLVVWTHLCIGVHFWLRLKPGYRRAVPVLYAAAIVIPLLGLLGFARAGLESATFVGDAQRMAEMRARRGTPPPERARVMAEVREWAPWGIGALYVLVLAARQARAAIGRRRATFTLVHANGRRVQAEHGQSVLEVLRAARIPHASVCGGRARCTTCRIRVGRGLEVLPSPSPLEAAALARVAAPPNVRLACQLRPRHDLDVTPVLPPDAGVSYPGGVQGREQRVVAMFVDLRDSTALGENKLPYDVVFVLNRFFEEMSGALNRTGGHYAQFSGDGLLALYGLRGRLRDACRDALRGAIEMERGVAALNAHLAGELPERLRIGIGVHAGEAIVGTMGPPSSPNLSAVGDNINIAARLEQQSKSLGCTLVVSAAVARHGELDLARFPVRALPVRGRNEPIEAYVVENVSELEPLLSGALASRA